MLKFLFKKNMVWPAVGFGVGGLLWGLEAYRGTVGAGETFTNPFSYVLGAVAMAVFGGISLAYINQLNGSPSVSRSISSRQTWKIIGLGLIGWLAAFFVPGFLGEWSLAIGSIITPLIFGIAKLGIDIVPYIILKPSLVIGQLWFHFFIGGLIMGAVYAFLLKTNIIKTALWGGIGFALASLIGPIIGNLIGNLFGSLLVSYLVTFLVIGKAFGFAVGRALR